MKQNLLHGNILHDHKLLSAWNIIKHATKTNQ